MPVDFRSTNVDIHINFNICIYTPAFIHRTTNIASTDCTCMLHPHLSGFSGYVVRDATPQRDWVPMSFITTRGWHHLPINKLSTKTLSTSKISSGKHLFSKKNSERTNYTVYPTCGHKEADGTSSSPWQVVGSVHLIASETLLTLHSFAASHRCTVTDQEPPASLVNPAETMADGPVLAIFPGFPIQICSNLHIDDLQRLWKSLSKERLAGQKSPCQRCKCSKNHPS